MRNIFINGANFSQISNEEREKQFGIEIIKYRSCAQRRKDLSPCPSLEKFLIFDVKFPFLT